MRTTVNLEPEAYRLARALASKRRQSVGKILGDAVLSQFRPSSAASTKVEADEHGFPSLYLGRPVTPEDVAAAIEEE